MAVEGGYRFQLVHVDTPLAAIEGRRRANENELTRERIVDAVFRHHHDRFERPDADEPCLRLISDAEVERWIATLCAIR